ncbi:unnamed protein product [Ilex paraguariensis]|uniref:Uncharacterized protein n=1 Tax=Ilex paraguariensis TaxID=185542 RepID=A0ABC8U2I0_9AQUA
MGKREDGKGGQYLGCGAMAMAVITWRFVVYGEKGVDCLNQIILDFVNLKATGRFCNGKLATDTTADDLGFTTYPPAYLSPQASGKNFLIGANFASAASGYDDKTAILNARTPSYLPRTT